MPTRPLSRAQRAVVAGFTRDLMLCGMCVQYIALETKLIVSRYHFDQYHVNGPRLHQHTAQIQKQSRSGGAHPLRNGMQVSPINATFQQAAYNSQTTGPVSYQSHGPPAAYGSMPPPPVQNQVPCSLSAARPLTDQQAFVEVSRWSSSTRSIC
jgi:hypothetical protein